MAERRHRPGELRVREPLHRPWLGALAAVAMAGVLAVALLGIPRGSAPLPHIARQALTGAVGDWNLPQPVNAVVYGYRAFDTFGETFLLLAAVVSVWVIARTREQRRGFVGEEQAAREERAAEDPAGSADRDEHTARQAEEQEAGERAAAADPDDVPVGAPELERTHAMTVVTRTGIRLVGPLLAVAGVYLVAQPFTPGGGFPAGVVAVGVILLLFTGFGYQRIAPARPASAELVELVVALGIVVVMCLGLVRAGSVTANWLPLGPYETLRSGGLAQVFSVSEFLEVAAGLTLAVFALLGMRHDWGREEQEEDDEP